MAEPVEVTVRKFGYFPAQFRLAGKEVKIDAVERCWTDMHPLRGIVQYHFRVRCGSKLYRLSQNAQTGTWSIQPEGT